jgi:hypothetical protein
MRQGPEYVNGWRKAFDIDGHRVRIEAFHVTRKRPPRGHELVSQMSRGRPYSNVEETEFTWRLLTERDRQSVVVWANPNGTVFLPALRSHHQTVEKAAVAYVHYLFGQVEEPSTPSP